MAQSVPFRQNNLDVGIRGNQQVLQAQKVANQTPNSRNYTENYSKEMGMAGTAMRGAGRLMETLANLGVQADMSKFNRRQQDTMRKFNDSAGKLGQAQSDLNNIKNQQATAQGVFDALTKAGCDFADALKNAQDKLDDLAQQASKANTDLKNAQSNLDRAKQDFQNANTPSSGKSSQQRRTESREALDRAKQAEKDLNSASSELGRIEPEYNKALAEQQTARANAEQNASELVDSNNQLRTLNDMTGMTQKEFNDEINRMGSYASQMRQSGKDVMNDIKDWNMVRTAGAQTSGWANAVTDFGNGEYWKGTASSLNQTYNTLSGASGFGATPLSGMVSPFLQQALTSAGQTLQNGGSAQDFAQSFLNATMGLSDVQQGFNSIANSFEYAKAGDNFMSAVSANNAIPSFVDALGKMTQTGSLFAPTLQPVSPFAQHLASGVGEFMRSAGGDLISLQEIQKVANQTFENFAGTATAYATTPLNAFATGVAGIFDSVAKAFGQDLGAVQQVQEWRRDALETFTDVDLTQYIPSVNIPTLTNEQNTPPFNPNSPNPIDALKDPFATSSRDPKGKNCPPKKPAPSSIAFE